MSVPRRLLQLGLLMILIAYLYTLYTRNKTKAAFSPEQAVLASWNKIIELPSVEFRKVMVGVNANVDLIVSGPKLLVALNSSGSVATDHEIMHNLQDFEQSFAYFFSKGAAAERYLSDGEMFHKIFDVAQNLRQHEFAVGGNAAIIAQKLAAQYTKTKVLLVGPIGPRLKALLHPNVETRNYTRIRKDESHIIMEYNVGEMCGDFIAPASSRFITSHGTLSQSAIAIDMFFNTMISYKPDLIVLSGLHLLDVLPEEMWQEKLRAIKKGLNQVSYNVPIHLELASIATREYAKNLIYRILPKVDSLGLSEQELAFISQIADGPHSDIFPAVGGTLHVHKVADILYWIMQTWGRDKSQADSKKAQFRLERIHFHCLTYHLVVTRGPDWSNTAAAISAGARTSSSVSCGTDSMDIDPHDVELRIPDFMDLDRVVGRTYRFNPHQPLSSWMRDTVLFIFTPVLVCKHPIKTVGVGDEVSAVSLLYSQFYRFEK